MYLIVESQNEMVLGQFKFYLFYFFPEFVCCWSFFDQLLANVLGSCSYDWNF